MWYKNKWCLLVFLSFFCLGSVSCLEYNISAPEEIKVGEWFEVNVTAYSEKDLNFSVYSYVYKGFNCVGQGWIINKKEINLNSNEKKEIVLSDLVKHNTPQGFYNLRTRFKLPDNQTITDTRTVKVVARESLKEIYLYGGLISLCIVGLLLAFRYNR